jgi:5-methylcytosine-specific restriction enzyme subunit McrC
LYLSANLTSDLVLRTKARRLARLLGEEIKSLPLSNHLFDEAYRSLNRLTRAYEPALTLIRLLMDGQGISLEDNQSLSLKGFLFDMNHFWENLLGRFLRENLPNYTVYNQARLRGMMTYARDYNPKSRKAPVPRPDYIVMQDGKLIAMLDAKYRDIWNKGLPRDMLYQLGIYALSQGHRGNSTILYPSISEYAASEIIEIRDILGQSYQASIRLQPVSLNHLRDVLALTGYKGEIVRKDFALSLIMFPS